VREVLRMDQYSYIRTAVRVYKKGIRELSKETGHHPVTHRVDDHNFNPNRGGSILRYHGGSFLGCHYYNAVGDTLYAVTFGYDWSKKGRRS
jgi:hypothetical protein